MVLNGFFICIEGLDGCGKTTQAKLLVKAIKKNCDAIYTAEPSKGKIGTLIKKHCLHGEQRRSAIVEALLFAADRFEHVETSIKPALSKGQMVVSDRYLYSSLAYQGAAGLNLEWIEKINAHSILPDLAVFIDVEPETVIQRLKPVRSVMENLETQKKVLQVYLKYVQKGRLTRIDGNKPQSQVSEDLANLVRRQLKIKF